MATDTGGHVGSTGTPSFAPEGWEAPQALSGEIVSYFDADLRFLYASEVIPQAGELLGRSLLELIEPAQHDEVRAAVEGALRTGMPHHYTVEAMGPDGTRATYSNWVVRQSFEGHDDCVAILTLDLSHPARSEDAARRAESAAEQAHRALEAVAGNSSDYIVLVDRDYRVHLINRPPEGLTRAQLIGSRVTDWLASEEQGEVTALIDRVFATGEPGEYTTWSELPQGRRIFVTRVSGVTGPASDARVTLIARDVTEERRLAAQLQQASKLQAIGQLTGGVAHDFNNLLTVMMGNLELIRMSAEDGVGAADIPRLAGSALEAAQRGSALTHRLLAFSRKQPLQPRRVDCNRLISGMEDMLRRTLGETIAIETVIAAGLWECAADPTQLESALLNLAINARDAMPGGGKLTLETANARLDPEYVDAHPELASGQYVMLAVTDTGEGMTPEVLDRVFEPFFTTKGVGEGSGLGLSMVYGFIKQSGGHVKLYSEPGQGTTVRLYLPRAGAETVTPDPRPVLGRDPVGAGELVLVVEDDERLRVLSVELLERLGYRTLAAGSGPEGLSQLASHPDVQLLFTDVVLPDGMSGVELAAAAVQRCPGLKVLFTSGYTENAIIHHGRLDPGVELLEKPFTIKQLARRVRQVLDA